MAAVPAAYDGQGLIDSLSLEVFRSGCTSLRKNNVSKNTVPLLREIRKTRITPSPAIMEVLLHRNNRFDSLLAPFRAVDVFLSLPQNCRSHLKKNFIRDITILSPPTVTKAEISILKRPTNNINLKVGDPKSHLACPQHSVGGGANDQIYPQYSGSVHFDREGSGGSIGTQQEIEAEPGEEGVSQIELRDDDSQIETLVRSIDSLILDCGSDAAEVTVPPCREGGDSSRLVSKETDEDGKGMTQNGLWGRLPLWKRKVNLTGTAFDSKTKEDIHEWKELFASGIEAPTFTRPGALHYLKMSSYLLSELQIDPLRLIASVFFMATSKKISAQVPEYLRAAVNSLRQGNGTSARMEMIDNLTMYCALQVIQIVSSEFQTIIFAELGEKTRRALMKKVFAHLHDLDFLFHSGRSSGCVARILERGASAMQLTTSALVFEFIPNMMELYMMEGMLRRNIGPRLAQTSSATMALFAGWTLASNHYSSRAKEVVNRYDNIASSRLHDSLSNHQLVKLYNGESTEVTRLDTAQQALGKASVAYRKSISTLVIGQNLILAGGISLMYRQLMHDVLKGKLTVGDLVLFKAYIFQVRKPIEAMGFMYRKTRQGLTDLSNLFQLLTEISPNIRDPDHARPLTKQPAKLSKDTPTRKLGRVEVRAVDYQYSKGSKMALKALNLSIKPGEVVGIVGESGSGKSTLVRLLSRLVDPKSGSILIDGVDISNITLKSLRDELVVVPQEPLLFNDTIAYNISYGNLKAGRYEIEDAATKARIHDTIRSRPEGYHTIVGQAGVKLSGGERQRLSLARALLKNPRILVYDEATASLDPSTELGVVNSILALPQKPTSIIITHRLSTIRNADRIVVLSGGRIAESGTHEQLLRTNGKYAAMWNQQQGF
eukprot:TRINITY_DN18031_c0_g1_i1.p1 TRINITY_DN18031_c0_g1~~TRINITY_DN18031_c0_g1_i1.p1  ORF type:complete len:888 (+),score=140.97 TRINITY_DN18031_c0_g1_i1:77-2740(+)